MSEPPTAQPPPVGSIALLVLAGFAYIPMLMAVIGAPEGDPAAYGGESRMAVGWAELFTLFFGGVVWLALGILLLLGGRKGEMPPWARAPAAILYVLSAVAAWGAFEAYIAADGGWSFLVPVLLPPLIAGYGLWLRLPALVSLISGEVVSRYALSAMGFVIVAALPLAFLDQLQLPAHVARDERQMDAVIARQQAELVKLKQEEDARFRTLTTDSSLSDYLDYIHATEDGDPRHQQALDGARHVKGRQDDAIRLLDQGKVMQLKNLWDLDLHAAPALCAAYDQALLKMATTTELFDLNAGDQLEWQLPNMKFLAAGHCDLDTGLAAAEARIRKIIAVNRGDERWEKLLATLTALRQPQ